MLSVVVFETLIRTQQAVNVATLLLLPLLYYLLLLLLLPPLLLLLPEGLSCHAS